VLDIEAGKSLECVQAQYCIVSCVARRDDEAGPGGFLPCRAWAGLVRGAPTPALVQHTTTHDLHSASSRAPDTRKTEMPMAQPTAAQPTAGDDAAPIAPATLRAQVAALTAQLQGRALDGALDAWLNANHGPGTATFEALQRTCRAGVRDGWLCDREGGGIRYGRIFKPADDLHGFSVDVVDMQDIAGPHHTHPLGEIDLVMPVEGEARFDGRPAGWCVYGPGTAHRPTVSGGRALVLYLLPQGQIQFTR
jgi:hypothetical protein